MSSRRTFIEVALGSLFCFPIISWAKEKPSFSTTTFIKVPTNVSPTLNPDLMTDNSKLVNKDWNYWHKFKSIKTHFERNGYLLRTQIIPTKNKSLFAVHSHWKSKEAYTKWLQYIGTCKFKKELCENNIHWYRQVN